jgi:hypothetical protein
MARMSIGERYRRRRGRTTLSAAGRTGSKQQGTGPQTTVRLAKPPVSGFRPDRIFNVFSLAVG